MATIDIGKVRPTFEGEWNSGKGYEAVTVVVFEGTAYQSAIDVPAGAAPVAPGSPYWFPIASKGADGDPGPPGVPGPPGAQMPISDSITSPDSGVAASSKAAYLLNAEIAALSQFAGLPRGIIVIWSGSIDTIPAGWALCDGQNETPDLRDRFVVGAGSSYAVAVSGGAAAHVHAITVGHATLLESQIPSHYHTLSGWGPGTLAGYNGEGGGWGITGYTGGSGAHNHTGSADSRDNRPPYYALAYIMKL